MRSLEIRFMEYQKAVEKSDKNLERAKKRNKFHHARLEAIKKQIDSQVEPGTTPHPDYEPTVSNEQIETNTNAPEEKPNEQPPVVPE